MIFLVKGGWATVASIRARGHGPLSWGVGNPTTSMLRSAVVQLAVVAWRRAKSFLYQTFLALLPDTDWRYGNRWTNHQGKKSMSKRLKHQRPKGSNISNINVHKAQINVQKSPHLKLGQRLKHIFGSSLSHCSVEVSTGAPSGVRLKMIFDHAISLRTKIS